MTIDIVDDLEKHKKTNDTAMNRDDEGHEWNDSGFQYRFQWMKSIGRPGAWVGGFVVNQMHRTIDFRQVHKAVNQVEISVMEKKQEYKAEDIVTYRVLVKVQIKL